MAEFWKRFAGAGEDLAGFAGQFAYDFWPTGEAFGFAGDSSLGDWKDARLLYHSRNGDAVLIQPNGATAWRVVETQETIPIASTFEEFVALYAEFRGTHEVFDSWAYREFYKGKLKK